MPCKAILRAHGGKHTDQRAAAGHGEESGPRGRGEGERGQRPRGRRGRQEYISSTNPLTILKVKLMEIHPLHEVTKGFGLKGSEAWITDLPADKKKRPVGLAWGLLTIFLPH